MSSELLTRLRLVRRDGTVAFHSGNVSVTLTEMIDALEGGAASASADLLSRLDAVRDSCAPDDLCGVSLSEVAAALGEEPAPEPSEEATDVGDADAVNTDGDAGLSESGFVDSSTEDDSLYE